MIFIDHDQQAASENEGEGGARLEASILIKVTKAPRQHP